MLEKYNLCEEIPVGDVTRAQCLPESTCEGGDPNSATHQIMLQTDIFFWSWDHLWSEEDRTDFSD